MPGAALSNQKLVTLEKQSQQRQQANDRINKATSSATNNQLSKAQSYRSLFGGQQLSTVPEEESSINNHNNSLRTCSSASSLLQLLSPKSSSQKMNTTRIDSNTHHTTTTKQYNEMYLSSLPTTQQQNKLSTSQSMKLNYNGNGTNGVASSNAQSVLNKLRPILTASTMTSSPSTNQQQQAFLNNLNTLNSLTNKVDHDNNSNNSHNGNHTHQSHNNQPQFITISGLPVNISNSSAVAAAVLKSKKFKPTTYYTSYANSKQEIDYSSYLYSDSITELYMQKGEVPSDQTTNNYLSPNSVSILSPSQRNNPSYNTTPNNTNTLTKTLSKSILNDLNILYNKQQILNSQQQQLATANSQPNTTNSNSKPTVQQPTLPKSNVVVMSDASYNKLVNEFKRSGENKQQLDTDLRLNSHNLAQAKNELQKQQQLEDQLRQQKLIQQQQLHHQQKLKLLQMEQTRLQKQIELLQEQQRLLKQASIMEAAAAAGGDLCSGNAASNIGSGLSVMNKSDYIQRQPLQQQNSSQQSSAPSTVKIPNSRSVSLEKFRDLTSTINYRPTVVPATNTDNSLAAILSTNRSTATQQRSASAVTRGVPSLYTSATQPQSYFQPSEEEKISASDRQSRSQNRAAAVNQPSSRPVINYIDANKSQQKPIPLGRSLSQSNQQQVDLQIAQVALKQQQEQMQYEQQQKMLKQQQLEHKKQQQEEQQQHQTEYENSSVLHRKLNKVLSSLPMTLPPQNQQPQNSQQSNVNNITYSASSRNLSSNTYPSHSLNRSSTQYLVSNDNNSNPTTTSFDLSQLTNLAMFHAPTTNLPIVQPSPATRDPKTSISMAFVSPQQTHHSTSENNLVSSPLLTATTPTNNGEYQRIKVITKDTLPPKPTKISRSTSSNSISTPPPLNGLNNLSTPDNTNEILSAKLTSPMLLNSQFVSTNTKQPQHYNSSYVYVDTNHNGKYVIMMPSQQQQQQQQQNSYLSSASSTNNKPVITNNTTTTTTPTIQTSKSNTNIHTYIDYSNSPTTKNGNNNNKQENTSFYTLYNNNTNGFLNNKINGNTINGSTNGNNNNNNNYYSVSYFYDSNGNKFNVDDYLYKPTSYLSAEKYEQPESSNMKSTSTINKPSTLGNNKINSPICLDSPPPLEINSLNKLKSPQPQQQHTPIPTNVTPPPVPPTTASSTIISPPTTIISPPSKEQIQQIQQQQRLQQQPKVANNRSIVDSYSTASKTSLMQEESGKKQTTAQQQQQLSKPALNSPSTVLAATKKEAATIANQLKSPSNHNHSPSSQIRVSKSSSVIPIEIVHTQPKSTNGTEKRGPNKKLQIEINESIPIEYLSTSRINNPEQIKTSSSNNKNVNSSNNKPSKPAKADVLLVKDEVIRTTTTTTTTTKSTKQVEPSRENRNYRSVEATTPQATSKSLERTSHRRSSKEKLNDRSVPLGYQNSPSSSQSSLSATTTPSHHHHHHHNHHKTKSSSVTTVVATTALVVEKKIISTNDDSADDVLNEDEEVSKITSSTFTSKRVADVKKTPPPPIKASPHTIAHDKEHRKTDVPAANSPAAAANTRKNANKLEAAATKSKPKEIHKELRFANIKSTPTENEKKKLEENPIGSPIPAPTAPISLPKTTGIIDDVQKVVSESVSEATTLTTATSTTSNGVGVNGIDSKLLLDTTAEPTSTSSSNTEIAAAETSDQAALASDQEEPSQPHPPTPKREREQEKDEPDSVTASGSATLVAAVQPSTTTTTSTTASNPQAVVTTPQQKDNQESTPTALATATAASEADSSDEVETIDVDDLNINDFGDRLPKSYSNEFNSKPRFRKLYGYDYSDLDCEFEMSANPPPSDHVVTATSSSPPKLTSLSLQTSSSQQQQQRQQEDDDDEEMFDNNENENDDGLMSVVQDIKSSVNNVLCQHKLSSFASNIEVILEETEEEELAEREYYSLHQNNNNNTHTNHTNHRHNNHHHNHHHHQKRNLSNINTNTNTNNKLNNINNNISDSDELNEKNDDSIESDDSNKSKTLSDDTEYKNEFFEVVY